MAVFFHSSAMAQQDDADIVEDVSAPVYEPSDDTTRAMDVDEDAEFLDFGSLRDVVTSMLDAGQRRNSRQRIMRDVYAPYFLNSEEVKKYMVILNRRSIERRWLRDRYFSWSILDMTEDRSYGFGEVTVKYWGISRFWLPRANTIRLQANLIDGRWRLKGPDLIDIDINAL